MKTHDEMHNFGTRTLELSGNTQLRLAPLVGAGRDPKLLAVDTRLFRRMDGCREPWAVTPAGFRVPPHALRELSKALLAIADELGVP